VKTNYKNIYQVRPKKNSLAKDRDLPPSLFTLSGVSYNFVNVLCDKSLQKGLFLTASDKIGN
jgi:hypothetical protein